MSSKMPLDPVFLQKKAEEIVRDAGKIALDSLESVKFEQKGNEGDLVTEVDRKIEKFITEKVSKLIDGASVFGEEFGGNFDTQYSWLIDPIDGTKNYAHHAPSFFTHLVLLKDMKPIIGIIFDPVMDTLFSASSGNGAFINGKKIEPPKSINIEKSVVDLDFGGKEDLEWKLNIFKEIAERSYRVRVSAGRLAPYLLTGAIDSFVVLNPTTQLFDQAPRVLLAKESGFDVLDFERKTWKVRIMSNPSLTKILSEIIINH